MNKRKNVSGQLRDKIYDALKSHKQKSLALPQILIALDMQKHDKNIILGEIKDMLDEGLLVKTGSGRYGLPERLGYITGVLEGNRRGFAFLRPDRQEEDVFIRSSNLKNAGHGDRVVVQVDKKRKEKRRREGTVMGIIKRGQRRLVGTLQRKGKKYFVNPDDQRYPGEVEVSAKNVKQIDPGDKVIVEVEEWAQGKMPSRGRVVDHLGSPGSIQTERMVFKHRYELPGEHPANVLNEVEALPGEDKIPLQLEDAGRRDLRSLTMVTIDDETARDFDDAVSLEETEEGNMRLGVHIADVSHYVRSGKPLDREALKRGTSIYLVDRVIHMLPPALSENLCSLQAGKDRLAVSVFMDIDSSGDLLAADYTASVIRVAERLTYKQVETYLNNGKGESIFDDTAVPGMIDRMDRLAGILRQRRADRGTLDLDLPEAKIKTDDQGVPISIEKRTMGRSESLIEEFMIYCNETVATYLTEREVPCVYRVHAVPTEEKLLMLRETLTLMNIKAARNIKILKPKHLKKLLEDTKGEPNERLVRYLVLRSMPQARYSASNDGHFGLASKCYCHFTSPIRRYPDLVVHRILKEHLTGEITPEKISRLQTRLPGIAEQSSERERAAVDAERASIDVKKAQYMEQKIGEIYTGIINGVTNFGLFVELDNTVEGMIPIGDLGDDYFFYNEKAASLTGERSRKSYRLGDIIEVQVVKANREEGKVTFAPAPAD